MKYSCVCLGCSKPESFKGYGPEQGYAFLRNAIAENDYQINGVDINADEIFVSDGSKCDCANILDIFGKGNRILMPDPVYPVYLDTNVMAGRTGGFDQGRYADIVYLESTRDNGYIPDLPKEKVDLIYLCFPNNPTGATITGDLLQNWVDYARDNSALILFDAAYEAFIRDETLPHSIYEIPGARDVAIEFRSFSKTAGFTGTRCAYTVVPSSCMARDGSGQKHSLHNLWNRRQTTKFNGVSYPVQVSAAAIYTDEGTVQVASLIDYYLKNAAHIREKINALGYESVGGVNSPYVWVNTNTDSWEFFDLLLNKAGVVCTPGAGFGTCGQGYVRISAFNNFEQVQEAMSRITQALKR